MCKDQINRERSYAGYKPIGKLCCERSAGNMFGEAELANRTTAKGLFGVWKQTSSSLI